MSSAASAKNVRFISRCDQGGRPDGVQVILHKGHAFIGHMFSDGYSVVDVRDPRQSEDSGLRRRPKEYPVAPSANPRRHPARRQRSEHLGHAAICEPGRLLRQIARRFRRRPNSHSAPACASSTSRNRRSRARSDFSNTAGLGAHRIWWVGGRYAYVSVHFEGFIDHVLAVVDVSNPEKPKLAGRWWLPGMNRAGGETPPASFGKRTALHHLISAGNIGYAAWRDGGYTIHDLSDPANPEAAEPPQLRAALRRRRAHAAAAAEAQAAGARRRGDLGELRQRAGLHLGDRRARRRQIRSRSPRCRRRTRKTSAPRARNSAAQSARKPARARCKPKTSIFATYHNAGLRIYDIRRRLPAEASRLFRAARAGKNRRPAAEPGQGHPVLRRLCRQRRTDVSHRHQCGPLHPAIRRDIESTMAEKFGRLALHMWTIDTTPLETALDAAKQAGYRRGRATPHRFQALLRCRHEQCAGSGSDQEKRHSLRRSRRRIRLAVCHRRGEQTAVQSVPRNPARTRWRSAATC